MILRQPIVAQERRVLGVPAAAPAVPPGTLTMSAQPSQAAPSMTSGLAAPDVAADRNADVEARVAQELQRRLSDAHAALEQERIAVLEEAKVKGHAEGLAAAEQQLRQIQVRADALLARIAQSQEQHLEELEAASVELAVQAAARIVGEGLLDRSLLQAWIRTGLQEMAEPGRTTLHLNAADAAWVKHHKLDLDVMEVVADPRLAAGHAELRSDAGSLDLGLASQISGLVDALQPLRAVSPTGSKGM